MAEKPQSPGRRQLTKAELRAGKLDRRTFRSLPRLPVTVVLDGVRRNYNIGAIFRLCDAFLVERLVICGKDVDLRKRKLVQAARGTERWVPWHHAESALPVVQTAKAAGASIVVVEQMTDSIPLQDLQLSFPTCFIFGSEGQGVSQEVVDLADVAVSIPMFGMANSINVASAAAITLYQLSGVTPRCQ
jgi:tRNA G18 (ribose-2'-O)-methylase SpoU